MKKMNSETALDAMNLVDTAKEDIEIIANDSIREAMEDHPSDFWKRTAVYYHAMYEAMKEGLLPDQKLDALIYTFAHEGKDGSD